MKIGVDERKASLAAATAAVETKEAERRAADGHVEQYDSETCDRGARLRPGGCLRGSNGRWELLDVLVRVPGLRSVARRLLCSRALARICAVSPELDQGTIDLR